ncbi:hypothetical protein ACHAWF_014036, partial [Thalassiosira exigua]
GRRGAEGEPPAVPAAAGPRRPDDDVEGPSEDERGEDAAVARSNEGGAKDFGAAARDVEGGTDGEGVEPSFSVTRAGGDDEAQQRGAPSENWMRHYERYVVFCDEDRAPMLTEEERKKAISWASSQRRADKLHRLTKRKKALLEEIGVDLATEWNKGFDRFSRFFRENGTVPSADGTRPDEAANYKWMMGQKKSLDRGQLAEERIERLTRIGVRLDEMEEAPTGRWAKRFDRLKAHSRRNGGDANVEKGVDQKMIYWVRRQRKLFRNGTLGPARAALLKSIGLDFDWCKRKVASDRIWESMYSNLVDYRREHGHCDVPWDYRSERHGKLGWWVSSQKSLAAGKKKKGERPPSLEKKEKLLKLGFDFELNRQWKRYHDNNWDKKLEALVEHLEANGGKYPSHQHEKGLANWVMIQRNHWRRGTLERDRLEKLEAVQFDFASGKGISKKEQDDKWNEMLDLLVRYKAATGGKDPKPSSVARESCQERGDSDEDIEDGKDSSLALQSEGWGLMFDMLVDFFEVNGHCNIGGTPNLENWVEKMQRSHCGGVPSRQMDQLQAILDRTPAKCWYGDCSKFASNDNGLCRSHSSEDTAFDKVKDLAKWVAKQRETYQRGTLAQGLADRLKEAGFDFKVKGWEEMFALLAGFYEDNGHCAIGTSNPQLSRWVGKMRRNIDSRREVPLYLRDLLLPILQGTGAKCWYKGCRKFASRRNGLCRRHSSEESSMEALSDQWKEMYRRLIAFVEDKGHCNIGDNSPGLRAWMSATLENSQSSKKHQQQLQLLEVCDQKQLPGESWRTCNDEKCDKFALFYGWCHSHCNAMIVKTAALDELVDESESGQGGDNADTWEASRSLNSQTLKELQVRVFEAVEEGEQVEPPELGVDFDIGDPPETFRDPSELLALNLDPNLGAHDVVFNPSSDTKETEGNISFRQLLYDSQPFYIMAPLEKKFLIAKSLVFIVQKRGGRFFNRETGPDGRLRLHELSDEDATELTKRKIRQGHKISEIKQRAIRFLAIQKALHVAKEKGTAIIQGAH